MPARGLAAANGFLNRGLFDLAVDEYRRFLNDHPDHADVPVARYGLSVALFRQGKLSDAAIELKALESDEGFAYRAEVLVMLGQCRLALKDAAGAVEPLRTVVSEFGKHGLADDAGALLVESLYRSGQWEEASKACGRFLERWPDAPGLDRALYFGGLADVHENRTSEATERFARLHDRHGDSPFAGHATLLLAQSLHTSGKIDAAADHYREVLNRADDHYRVAATIGLASIERQQGDTKAAAKRLEPLAAGDDAKSLDGAAWMLIGRLRFDLNQYEPARDAFAKVSAENERANEAAYWSAKCLLRMDQPKMAAKALRQAIDAANDNGLLAEMTYDLAVAEYRSDRLDEAAEMLSTFLEKFKDHALAADALKLAISIEHARKNYAASAELAADYLKQFGNGAGAADVAFTAAENAYLLGRHAESAEAFRQFVSKFPEDSRLNLARYRLGMALYQTKKSDEAMDVLSALAKSSADGADYPLLHFVLGDLDFGREKWESAIREFDAYLKGKGEHTAGDDAMLKSGLALARLNRIEEAETRFDRLLTEFRDSPHRLQALFERGQCRLLRKAYDDAAKDFEAVLSSGGDSRFTEPARRHLAAIAMQRGDFAGAAEGFDAVARSAKGTDAEAEALYQQGVALLASKKLKPARRALERLLDRFPDDARSNTALANLMIILARQKEHEAALKTCAKVKLDKLSPELRSAVLYERAWCLRPLKREGEAVDAYRDLLAGVDSGPLAAHALVEWAELEADADHPAEAVQLLERYAAASAKSGASSSDDLAVRAAYRLGVCRFKLKEFDRAAEALAGFSKTSADRSLKNSAAYFRGEALFELGRFDEAASEFARIVERTGKSSEGAALAAALLRLGESKSRLQQWPGSEEAFAAYLERFADADEWYQAAFGLGWARENQERYGDAIKSYRTIVERHQGLTAARAQFQIGQCLFAQKKLTEAAAELLKVDILYAYPEWSAAALYEAGRCFEQLHQGAQAKQQFNSVVEKYKETRWAEMAASRLKLLAEVSLPGKG